MSIHCILTTKIPYGTNNHDENGTTYKQYPPLVQRYSIVITSLLYLHYLRYQPAIPKQYQITATVHWTFSLSLSLRLVQCLYQLKAECKPNRFLDFYITSRNISGISSRSLQNSGMPYTNFNNSDWDVQTTTVAIFDLYAK